MAFIVSNHGGEGGDGDDMPILEPTPKKPGDEE